MTYVCPKCGFERSENNSAPEDECPKCGIVYSKYSKSQDKTKKTIAHSEKDSCIDNSGRRADKYLVCIGIVISIFVYIKTKDLFVSLFVGAIPYLTSLPITVSDKYSQWRQRNNKKNHEKG